MDGEMGATDGKEMDLDAVGPAPSASSGFGGEMVKSFVFGGLDGILSTFALVAGLSGARVPVVALIAVSCAKIFADALSMGFGEFMSANAEAEMEVQVRKKQLVATDKDVDSQMKELTATYVEKGGDHNDAQRIVSLLANTKGVFNEHMLMFKHGIMGGAEGLDIRQSLKQGALCFIAFALFGLIPLIGFIIFYAVDQGRSDEYWNVLGVAYGLTAMTLFTMGFIKTKLTGSSGALMSGASMLVNGTIAGGLSFVLGEALSEALALVWW